MAKIFDKINLLKNTSVNRNLLINGNFDIWQRGVSFNSTGFTADRWYLNIDSGTTKAYKMTGGGSLTNSTSFIRLETTSNNSKFSLAQPIESTIVSQVRGSYVTLTFYAKLPTGTNNWSGNIYARSYYSTIPDNLLINRIPIETSYLNSSITLNNTWTKYTVSFLVPADANVLYVEVYTDAAQSASSILDLAQFKLETGQFSTTLNPVIYSEELFKCKRYYQKLEAKLRAGTGYGGGNTPRKFSIGIPLQNMPRSSNPSIQKISAESNDVSLSNIVAIFSANNILNITADSTSPYSELSSVFAIEDEIFPSRIPGPVSNVSIIRTDTSADLTWDPAPDFNSSIFSYSIYHSNSPTKITSNVLNVTGVSGTITGINPISPYYFQIYANNSIGKGDASSIYYLGPAYTTPSGIQSLSGTWGNDVSNLSWTTPLSDGGSPITGYIVQRSMYSGYSPIELNFYTVNTSASIAKSITQISATGTYYYRVAALNIAGTGSFTNFSLSKTTPLPPNTLSTSTINSGIIITYGLPSGNGGDPISSINIQYSASTGFTTVTGANYSPNYSPVTISPLTNGSTIYFRARNQNNLGYGPFSTTVSAVPNRPLTVPGSPTNLIASWLNDTFTTSGINNVFNLIWTAPLDDGGSPIINYTVFLGADGGFSSGIGTYNTINSNRSIDIISPTGYSTIYIRLKANNIIGASSYSSGISRVDNIPLAPSIVSVIAGDTSGVVSYKPSPGSCGAPVTGYAIDYSTSSTFASSVTTIYEPVSNCNAYNAYYSNTPCSKTISNLTNNTLYYIRIKGINNIGTGLASNVMTVRPQTIVTKPSKPLNLTVTRFKTSGVAGTTLNSVNYLFQTPYENDMTAYTNSNGVFAIPLVGGTLGTLYGSGIYTHNSSLSRAAVQQGLLSIGQQGTVFVEMLPGQSSYIAASVNGIISYSYGSWNKSYKMSNFACPNNDAATFSWSGPINNGGANILQYVIQTGTSPTFATTGGSIITSTLTTYRACATKENFYTRIAAINSAGTGEWSDTVYTIQNYLSGPSPVNNFTITYSGIVDDKQRYTLSWSPPSSLGGATGIQFYTIYDGRSWVLTQTNISGNITGISYDFISPGWHQLSIVAYNGTHRGTPKTVSVNVPSTGLNRPVTWVFSIPAGSVPFSDPNLVPSPTQTDLSNVAYNKSYGSYIVCTGNISGNYITADFGNNVKIEAIAFNYITSTRQYTSYIPYMTGSIIQGSNDNTNWTTLTSSIKGSGNIFSTSPATLGTNIINVNSSYRYIRLFTPPNSTLAGLPVSYIQAGVFYFGSLQQ